MPSLNPNTNFELILIARKEQLVNPFAEDFNETCQRVLVFLANIQNTLGNLFLKEKNLNGEEFFLTMPTIAAFVEQIYLFEAILDHSQGKISDQEIKQHLINFVDAHTVVWINGIPKTKKGLYGAWTTKLEMFELTLIENGVKTDNKCIVNDLQYVLIDQLWKLKNPNNSIEARIL